MPNLHLFSSPGRDDLRYILEASRPYLKDREDATVAYIPLASLYVERWLADHENAFRSLARIEVINTETMSLPQMEDVIRRAVVAYIPGGNTFLLAHRLHTSRLMPFLRKKIQAGLPLIAYSAGTILCGPNILTAVDMNAVETSTFGGLNILPFNFSTHYPLDMQGQAIKDGWLAQYYSFHDNPLVMLCDGAYIKTAGRKTTLVRGEAWIMRKGRDKEKLEEGQLIDFIGDEK